MPTKSDTRESARVRRMNANSDAAVRRASGTLRVVGYARVSTEYQVERLSFDWQADVIRDAACAHGWELVEVVREQGSGKSVRSRARLSGLLDRLDAGELDALVVAKLDRLSRSTLDFYALMDRARRQGWAIVSLNPVVDMTTPFGKAMAGMAAIFAELEREMIGQRQRESIAARRARGVYKEPPKLLSDDVDERIAHLMSEGFGARRIARQLELEGFRPPRASTWQPSTVQTAMRRLAA
jgi:DNA invertase Pin-like site-specific DNA recombinase